MDIKGKKNFTKDQKKDLLFKELNKVNIPKGSIIYSPINSKY